VSKGKDDPCLLDFLSNFDTLVCVHSQGLFAEDMKASPRKLDCEFGMHPIVHANDSRHCDPWFPSVDTSIGCGEQFLVRYEDVLDGDTTCRGEHLARFGTRFSYCDYRGVVRVAEDEIGE
jgi:hypothetical protein